MNNETRILIVEDLISDYELAQHEICKVVKQSKFQRVENQKEFLTALEDFQPDLIISDYRLPSFDGMKALNLAQKHLPSVPVIIWTGTMGESIAVDCLKQGAVNYVLKDDMKRLGSAVVRALEERNLLLEKKRVEEKYRTIYENAVEGIFQSTPEGRLLSVNPAMARLYGYSSPAEMVAMVTDIGVQIYTDQYSRDQFTRLLLENDHIKNFEMKHQCKDGSVIWTSSSVRVVRDENGDISYYEGFLQDVTERKCMEDAEREQRTLAEALRHTAESLNSTLDYGEVLDQILTTVGSVVPSDAATVMLIDEGKARVVRSRGYVERGLKTEVMDLELPLPDTGNLRQMLETGKPLIVADTESFPDWKRSPANEWVCSNVGAPILLRGDVIGFILLDSETPGFFTPLHAQHLEAFSNQAALAIHNSRLLQQAQEEIAVRKQAEEALQQSEERFRLIAQNAEDLIWTMNMNFQITYISPAVECALGYSAHEILTSPPEQFLTPESYQLGLKAFQEEVDNVQVEPDSDYARVLEMEYRRRDGSVFWVETKFSFFRDPHGFPTAVLGVGRDITARKKAEAEVRDLLEFNEKILNHSPLGILTYKLTGECDFANENAATILGIDIKDLKSQNFHTISSWKISGLYDLANRAIATHSLSTADIHHKTTFGKKLWLRAHFVPFRSRQEDLLLLTISDITDRKLVEEKLRESENRLILALSAAQMSVWEWNLKSNEFLWSPEIYAITGIAESTFDCTFEGYTNLIHPQDVARVRQSAEQAVTSDTMFAEEFRIIRPDGEVRWLSNLGHAEYDQSGTSVRMIGTVQDISRRKQVEIERQALLEIMQGLARTADLHEILELIHRSVGNVIYAENFFVVFHNQDTGLFEEIYSVDRYDPPASPSRLEKSITSYVFRTGEPILMGRKLFEQLAAQGEVELIGTDSASWLGVPLKTSNGTIGVIVVQDYENPNRYTEHDKHFLASIATQAALALERRQIEERIRGSEERYRALFENSPISIWEEDFSSVKRFLDSLKQQGITDFPSYFSAHPEVVAECTKMIKVLDVNHAGLQMYRADSKRELLESTIQAPCKGEQEHNAEDFIAIAEGRTSNGWEGDDETMTGERLEINLRWSVAPGYEQDYSRVIVTVIDITERKRAEQELYTSEERFRQMAENIEEVFWLTDAQSGRELYLSPASEKIWGISAEHMMSVPNVFINSVLPEDRHVVLRSLEREKQGEKAEMEYRIVRPDGSVRWIWDRAFPVFDEDGSIKILAGIAADITERKNAEAEISRRSKETSALLETSLALTNLDLKAILQEIGNSAKDLFAADGCRIFLMQPDGQTLRCALALQESPSAFLSLVIKLGEGVTGSVAASGRAEIVNKMRYDPRAVHVPGTLEEEDEALMFAPLKERDHTIGVISVRRVGTDRSFEPADLEFLEAFASMAASAVSNARLLEETQRRLSELEALYENGLAVSQLLEPQQIGEHLIETFSRHLSWHHVAIRLVNPDTGELELIAFNQPGLKSEEKREIEQRLRSLINRVGQGLSGWVVQTGQSIRTGNVLDHPQYINTYPGIRSGIYMPLRVGERVIGVISVESEQPDALSAQDERLLATMANQAAIAFDNARLYQAAHQEIAERKLVEEELRESQERYRLLIDTSPDGIIMMNMDGTIRFSNQQMAGLFHLESPAELLGINFISLVSTEERAQLAQDTAKCILEDEAQEGHWLVRKDGTSFFGELHSSALRNEKGEQYAIIAQLRDVTERKQSQEALHAERQRFLDLFENSPIPTWLEDFTAVAAWMDELRAKGVINLREFLEENPDEYRVGVSLIRVLDVNHAAVIMNGAHNRQELLYVLEDLMLDKMPSPIMMHEFDMIWQGNSSFGFEMTSTKLDGSHITGILHVYIPANDGQPDYTRVIVTSTDITERVEIEKRLRASELHYRELADSITDVLFELDHDLRYTHWNKASEMLMGIPAREAVSKSMFEIFGESEEQVRIGRIYKSVLEEGQSKTFETEILLRGQKLVFEINANPSTHGVSVVARNTTERKLSETLMQKRFELVEYSAHHSFADVLQKTIDEASELTGSHIGFLHFIEEDEKNIRQQAWSTETLRDFCKSEGNGMHYPVEQAGVWADALRQRRSVIHNEYESLSGRKEMPEGHARVTREMVIPVIRNDRIVAVIGVGNKAQEYTQQDMEIAERFADYAWDITERKQMESTLAEERNQLAKRVEERTADLSRANSNLARALRVKDEFLANMSHELRTPLNAILGLSESLGEQVAGPLNEKQQKYLATINESGHHLLALINDILDLAKIEAGQITLDINKVDVNSVCQASLRMIKQLAQKKNQEVIFEIDHDLGLMWADERRLKQMIVNLLSNAVKFTPEYSRIGLEVHGDQAANKVVITVWDTGIGIKEEDMLRLFKPFVQLDSGLAREATGTGLGLALVAQMARLHGGSVHALSKPGEGSRFIVELPWEPAMATDMVAHLRNTGKFRAINPNAYRPTILLIEDTQEVVMMLVDYLEMAGYKMITAQDGVDGLEQANLTHPDLILMDIQMPRMDGFETTHKLRSDPEFKDVPIIALTALAMPNDRRRCLDAGMDEYISKPVNLKTLTKTIQKLLSPQVGVS
jgi:PAS domain S-box-containing protein